MFGRKGPVIAKKLKKEIKRLSTTALIVEFEFEAFVSYPLILKGSL